jgi:tyrosinase
MLTRALWLFAFICLSCTPTYSFAVPQKSKTSRQANSIHPVLGVRGLGIDSIHPRLEIRELGRNKDQFNVYLLGLQRLQNIAQNDKFSYYQIAGKLGGLSVQDLAK